MDVCNSCLMQSKLNRELISCNNKAKHFNCFGLEKNSSMCKLRAKHPSRMKKIGDVYVFTHISFSFFVCSCIFSVCFRVWSFVVHTWCVIYLVLVELGWRPFLHIHVASRKSFKVDIAVSVDGHVDGLHFCSYYGGSTFRSVYLEWTGAFISRESSLDVTGALLWHFL